MATRLLGMDDMDSYEGLGDNRAPLTPYFFNGPPSQLPGLARGSFCQSAST